MSQCNSLKSPHRRVFLYAASVVAPGAANLSEFLSVVWAGKSVLTPKKSLNNAFLTGTPKFDFVNYKEWLEERHGPMRYSLLNNKNNDFVKYAVGSLIDALSMRPGLEKVVKSLDPRVTIQYANGLGDLPTIQQSAREFDKGKFHWNSFWANPIRNKPCFDHVNGNMRDENSPTNPKELFDPDSYEYFEALKIWNDYWACRSPILQNFLDDLNKIEREPVLGADIEVAKVALIRLKSKARKELYDKYQCPIPPWESVSPNLLWNIPNVPASQVSMLLGLHGASSGYAGACASFGAILDNAMLEIQSGRTDLAIVGAVDAPPSDELISAFYSGRLAVLGDKAGVPFCDLRGTHISGGACTWIIGAQDVMEKLDMPSLGVEILGTGVSSDAGHIITPSKDGPKLALGRAFQNAQISPSDIQLWDMHATGTPGDWNEFTLISDYVPKAAYISARKGIFGHGMSVGGGWELTAQLLGVKTLNAHTFLLPPSGITESEVHPKITALERNLLLDKSVELTSYKNGLICGKLSMGLGGISSCVITRLLPTP